MFSVVGMSALYGVVYWLLFKWDEWSRGAIDAIWANLTREVVSAVRTPASTIAEPPAISAEECIAKPNPAVARQRNVWERLLCLRNNRESELPV